MAVNSKVSNLTIDGVTYDLVDETSGYAKLASPAFTGTPTAPTASSGDSSTQIATTAFVQNAMSGAGAGTVTSVGVSNATNGGLSVSGSPITSSGTISIGHSNVLTSAQSTSAVYPITIDKNGHIASYGNAVTIPTKTSDLTNDSNFVTTDTKNTAGSTNTNSKIYLIGATEQSANPQTYSDSGLYFNNGLHSSADSSGGNIYSTISQSSTNIKLDVIDNGMDGGGTLTVSTASNTPKITLGLWNGNTKTDYISIVPSGVTVTNLVTPTNNTDAATKKYVDDSIPTVPTNVSAFTNDAGYLTPYTETDPVFSASAASGITSTDITNWNSKAANSDFTAPTSSAAGTHGLVPAPPASGVGYQVLNNSGNWRTLGFSAENGGDIVSSITTSTTKVSYLLREATTTRGGLMSSADKSKLDNLSDITLPITTTSFDFSETTGNSYTQTTLDGSITHLVAEIKDTYNSLDALIPTVPTNVSAFTNDAGYLTSHQTIPVTDVTLNGSSIVSGGIAAITNANGDLEINGSLTTGDAICIPNNNRYQTKTSTNVIRNMIGLFTNNNLIIGSAAQREDYDDSTGYGGSTIVYGRAMHFYTGTSSSSDLDALWIQADGTILVNLDSTNDADLWAALYTAGWRTSPVVVP